MAEVILLQGVVYLDILVLVNAIIGYFTLKFTAYFASRNQNIVRICIASFVAGLTSLTMLITFLNAPIFLLLKILLASCVILIAFGGKSLRIFFKTLFYFIAFNILLGGVVILAVFCGANNINISNFSIYINISPILLIICIFAMYAVISGCIYVFGKSKVNQSIEFCLSLNNTKISGMALFDTGMHIKDAISSQSAILCSFNTLQSKLPEDIKISLHNYFNIGELNLPFWLVSVKTATGMQMLPATRCEHIILTTNSNSTKIAKPILVFTAQSIIDGTYDLIIHPNYLKEQ